MKRLLDIKICKLIKVVTSIFICLVMSNNSAFGFTLVSFDMSSYCGAFDGGHDYKISDEFYSDETKAKAKEYQDFQTRYKQFCKDMEEQLNVDAYRQNKNLLFAEKPEEYQKRFNEILSKNPEFNKRYQDLLAEEKKLTEELNSLKEKEKEEHERAVAAGEYVPCGETYPYGCPEGLECYTKRTSLSGDPQANVANVNLDTYDCKKPDDWNAGWRKAPQGSAGSGTSIEVNIAGQYNKVVTDETGETRIESNIGQDDDPGGCNIQSMRERYQSKCYSCVVIKTLMETFLNACSKAYDVTSEAGVKLLVLGALIWMAFFVMKNVSSLSSIEPGAMMNTLAVFLFKVMVAYILITSGLGVLIKYTINPLLTAGADMGIAFTDTVSNISKAEELLKDREKAPEVKVPTVTVGNASTEIVPAEVLNKVMLFAERLDKNVSTNLVIGHAVTCWSMKGGAWTFNIFGVSSQWTTIKVINLWLWFCGALIWFVGFMLTLGIGYYLLDISFKLGFSIMALPVAIGLWPFNITKGTVTKVISIMLKAAGTFVFLGLTTSYALAMISFALRDVNVLFDNVEKGNAQWISETFELTGPYFLIILFAFLYSMKLISSTISDYVNQFFADSVFGDADPMHKKLTQATDFAKQQLMKPVKKAVGKISNEVGEQAKEGAVRAGKFVRGLFKGKANGDVKSTNRVRSGGGGNNPMSNAGKATKAAGATAEQTGKGVQAAGKGAEVGGKVAQAGGKGIMSGGKGMVSSGATMCGTGVGAIVGVPMMIAGAAVMAGGAATYAAGKCAEVAGKAAQKAGKVIQKGGKAMKKAGEKMEKAGAKMEKLGNKLKFGDEKAPKPESEGKPDENNEKPTAQEEKPNKENQTDDKKAAGGKNEK